MEENKKRLDCGNWFDISKATIITQIPMYILTGYTLYKTEAGNNVLMTTSVHISFDKATEYYYRYKIATEEDLSMFAIQKKLDEFKPEDEM